jgi:hypothetical protein
MTGDRASSWRKIGLYLGIIDAKPELDAPPRNVRARLLSSLVTLGMTLALLALFHSFGWF